MKISGQVDHSVLFRAVRVKLILFELAVLILENNQTIKK